MHWSWRFAALYSSLWAFASAFAAEPRWIRAQSPNFEIYSTANESNVRSTLLEFEELRAFFETLAPVDTEKTALVRIVAFNSPKEFEPYRPTEAAAAYYTAGMEHDIIVMSHVGADTFPIAIHEYCHLAVNHWGLRFPPWLNEGMAELYSTLRSLPASTIVGDLIPGRVQALRTGSWVPLSVFLTVDSRSPYYNEKNKAGAFYNEAWALTHMLYLSPEYRPRFPDFLTAIALGKASTDALTSAYGKPLKAIEEDLRLYVRGDRFRAAVFPTRLRTEKLPVMPEPAPGFDVRLALVELKQHPDPAALRQELEALAAEQPEQPEPHVMLGYLIWTGPGYIPGKPVPAPVIQQVEKEFNAAFASGDRSPRMLWDYGRLLESRQPKDAEGVLRRLLTLQPGRGDVAVELAFAVLQQGQPADALKILNSLPEKMTSAEAPRYYTVSALVYSRLGQRDNARLFAQKLLDASKATPSDKQWAQRLLDSLV